MGGDKLHPHGTGHAYMADMIKLYLAQQVCSHLLASIAEWDSSAISNVKGPSYLHHSNIRP